MAKLSLYKSNVKGSKTIYIKAGKQKYLIAADKVQASGTSGVRRVDVHHDWPQNLRPMTTREWNRTPRFWKLMIQNKFEA